MITASGLPGQPGELSPALILAGGVAIGCVTVLGAWLARRGQARRELYFAAAGGALLAIAFVHLLPDAWTAATAAGMAWAVPVAAVASFGVASLAVRRGCACSADQDAAGGAATAGALAVHRLLEGAALALTGSVTVAIALLVHALAEGLAAGTLLRSVPARRAAIWLAAMCVSPVAGAALPELVHVPAAAGPVLVAIAAGVLAEAARVSLRAAFRAAAGELAVLSGCGAVLAAAAALTTLAVHAAG